MVEFPISRVVYRSNNNANSNGGVSYANANNDSSNTNTNIGSRLANNQNKFNRRTTPGTCPHRRAEGNKPQQQQPIGWKAEKLNGRAEFGRSSRLEELRPKEGNMAVVDRHLKKRFIRTTSASIEGRGMHDLMIKYIQRKPDIGWNKKDAFSLDSYRE